MALSASFARHAARALERDRLGLSCLCAQIFAAGYSGLARVRSMRAIAFARAVWSTHSTGSKPLLFNKLEQFRTQNPRSDPLLLKMLWRTFAPLAALILEIH